MFVLRALTFSCVFLVCSCVFLLFLIAFLCECGRGCFDRRGATKYEAGCSEEIGIYRRRYLFLHWCLVWVWVCAAIAERQKRRLAERQKQTCLVTCVFVVLVHVVIVLLGAVHRCMPFTLQETTETF